MNGVTTNYITQDGSIICEDTNGVQTWYLYDESGNLADLQYNGSTYYYVRNGQSDIIGILDSTGTQVVSYAYDSWGKLLSTTGSLASTLGAANPFRYRRGYYYDTETGFYYLQSRYYDPEVGRFLNEDGQLNSDTGLVGFNLYAFCNNNPITKSDYTGSSPMQSFSSMDEAAHDFAVYKNQQSIDDNVEFSASIYQVTEKIKTVSYKYEKRHFLFISYTKKTKITTYTYNVKYKYTVPKKGTTSGSPINRTWFAKWVGHIHTHGKYGADNFSSYSGNQPGDIDIAYQYRKEFFIYQIFHISLHI